MQLGGINLMYGPWADALALLAWVLLVGPALLWFAGQIGLSRQGQNVGVYTPMFSAFIGVVILNQLHRWPF
jgi:hypothetical protein